MKNRILFEQLWVEQAQYMFANYYLCTYVPTILVVLEFRSNETSLNALNLYRFLYISIEKDI